MYKVIDHTADIGIEVKGSSLEELFVRMAEAFFDLMFRVKRPTLASIEATIIVEAASADELMVKWLAELLYICETRHLVLTTFRINTILPTRLEGAAWGLTFDETRHEQKLSVKAVTYHQLDVSQDDHGRWKARVIFDI
jgi:SHS2 domain-containing protein